VPALSLTTAFYILHLILDIQHLIFKTKVQMFYAVIYVLGEFAQFVLDDLKICHETLSIILLIFW